MTDAPRPWTVLRLLDWTQGYFARADVEEPRLSAEVLLACTLGCERVQLYTRSDHPVAADRLTVYRDFVRRAAAGEPVAYLTGRKEFYSLPLKVTPDVLVPRPETELLVDAALAFVKPAGGGRMWDVCTGSGCVAIATAAQVPDLTVLATDISPEAVAVAGANTTEHGLGERVRCRQADLLALPDDCQVLAPFEVITANPPYVAEGDEVGPSVRYEPAEALLAGADGLAAIRPLVGGAADWLSDKGLLILEFGCGQADAVRDLIVAAGRFAEPAILRDHQSIERAAVARRIS